MAASLGKMLISAKVRVFIDYLVATLGKDGFYNGKRPYSSLDARSPDRAYFDVTPPAMAA